MYASKMIRWRGWIPVVFLMLIRTFSASAYTEEDYDYMGMWRLAPDAYQEVYDHGGRVVNLPEMESFFVVWVPDGFADQDIRHLLIMTHGTGMTAYEPVRMRYVTAGEKKFAIASIQWWMGPEDDRYHEPPQVHDIMGIAVDYMEETYGVHRRYCALDGFSRGSAQSWEVAFWDRYHATNFLVMVIAHSGGIPLTGGRDLPNEWLAGKWGPEPLKSTRYYLYCGQLDHGGLMCLKMENARDVIEACGGDVLELYEDPDEDHFGYNHSEELQRIATDLWYAQEPVDGPIQAGLTLNKSIYTAGDRFLLAYDLWPHGWAGAADVYLLLDVYGEYWYWPSWTQSVDFEAVTIEGPPVNWTIFDFQWPPDTGSADGIWFWGAALNPETCDLIGDFDGVSFGYR